MACIEMSKLRSMIASGRSILVAGALIALVGTVPGGAAQANEPQPGESRDHAQSSDDPLAGFAAAADHEIEVFRGRDIGAGAKIVTAQDLEGVVSGNVIEGTLTTGEVSIAPEAFSHFDGISSVIVNSGNNVSIQSSMVVNVTLED